MSIYQTTTIKLDMDNLHLYEMQLNNLLMLYGDAGEEARTQIAFDITKIKPKKEAYTGQQKSRIYQANFERWLKKRDKYKSDKGKVWNAIYASFSDTVINLIEQDFKKNYRNAI